MLLPLFIAFLGITPYSGIYNTAHLDRFTDGDSLTVYVFLLDDCVISQFYTPELTRLYDRYRNKGVGFMGYFPNVISTPEQIDAFASAYRLEFPLKPDYDKHWTRKFDITVTPEVAVWDHRTDQLIYRGRIDDSYVRVGKRKLHPQHRDLEKVIESWLGGMFYGATIETRAIGCFINFATPPVKN